MSRMFCTVKEAAETLDASEDQINTLLERGILHEFRQGPHRLVREAEIGALDLLRVRGPQAQVPAQPPVPAQPSSPRRNRRATQRKVRRGAAVAQPSRSSRASRSGDPRKTQRVKHKTAGPVPGTRHRRSTGPDENKAGRPEDRTALSPGDLLHVSPSYAAAVPARLISPKSAAPELVARPGDSRRADVRPPSGPPPAQTLRQWFWMGLVQDRPGAIALLSGLALLALSALVAGICLAAESF